MGALHFRQEALTGLKFAAVSGVGFLTDISVLHVGLHQLGLSPFAARAVSLTCAMQVTFLINGFLVFRCLSWRQCGRQWVGYMMTNGFGNLINYLAFVGLIGSRLPEVSRTGWAVVISSVIAYAFNFACARFIVFGPPRARATPSEPRPEAPACGPAAE